MTNNSERRQDLERIQKLTLMDDEFMAVCFNNFTKGAELLIRVIFNDPSLNVVTHQTELTVKNLYGHGVRLDITATDSAGKVYAIELQKVSKRATRKRSRYYSSLLDMHYLPEGDDYEKLPETRVVFVTPKDVFRRGKEIYFIERQFVDTHESFGDGTVIVYVNGENSDVSTALGRLLHDLQCSNPDEMYYSELATRVRYFKEDEAGVEEMSGVLEEMKREAARKAAKKAAKKEKLGFARTLLLQTDHSNEKIAELTGVPVEIVQKLAQKLDK